MSEDPTTGDGSKKRYDLTKASPSDLRQSGAYHDQTGPIEDLNIDQDYRRQLMSVGPEGLIAGTRARGVVKEHGLKVMRETSEHLLRLVKEKNITTYEAMKAKLQHDLQAVRKFFAEAEFEQNLDIKAKATHRLTQMIASAYERLDQMELESQDTPLRTQKVQRLAAIVFKEIEGYQKEFDRFVTGFETEADATQVLKRRKLDA